MQTFTVSSLSHSMNYSDKFNNKTDEMESPQEAKPARENSSLGFIEAVHQW